MKDQNIQERAFNGTGIQELELPQGAEYYHGSGDSIFEPRIKIRKSEIIPAVSEQLLDGEKLDKTREEIEQQGKEELREQGEIRDE